MQIRDRGAVVFGGGSGLGAATARVLAERGAKVLIADRDSVGGREVALEIGGSAIAVDVTDPVEVEEAVLMGSELGDGLRILVNCAGIGVGTKLVSRTGPTDLSLFEEVIRVNLTGTINTLRLGAAAMMRNVPDEVDGERGVCINTASIAAFDGQVGQIAYAASKGGVAALTLPAARELARVQVRVVTLAPGPFKTQMVESFPQRMQASLAQAAVFPDRLGKPEEFGGLVAHCVENSMINGTVIRIDGATRLPFSAPGDPISPQRGAEEETG